VKLFLVLLHCLFHRLPPVFWVKRKEGKALGRTFPSLKCCL
jgi:hypothetical protein